MKIAKKTSGITKKYLFTLSLLGFAVCVILVAYYWYGWRSLNHTPSSIQTQSNNNQQTDINAGADSDTTESQSQEDNGSDAINKTPIQYEGQSGDNLLVDDNRRFEIPEDEL